MWGRGKEQFVVEKGSCLRPVHTSTKLPKTAIVAEAIVAENGNKVARNGDETATKLAETATLLPFPATIFFRQKVAVFGNFVASVDRNLYVFIATYRFFCVGEVSTSLSVFAMFDKYDFVWQGFFYS